MTRLRHLALAGAVALAAACGGKSEPATPTTPAPTEAQPAAPVVPAEPALPSIPDQPAPAPESLLAEISIGDPNGQLSQLGAFADAIQPGTGAMLTPQTFMQGLGSTVQVPTLAGVDMQKPVYALVHDETAVPSAWLLVVPVADQAAVEQSIAGAGSGVQAIFHDGYAAIGSVEALVAGAPYALSARVKADTVPEPHVLVRMPVVLARYGDMIGAQLQGQMGPAAEPVLSSLQQIQVLEASLVVDKDAAGIEMSAAVAPGGSLSSFLAAQKPSTFAMVPHVGTQAWPVFAAGYLDLGQLAPLFSQFAGQVFGPLADEASAWLATASGELALGAAGGGDELRGLVMAYEVTQPDEAAKFLTAAFDSFAAKAKEGTAEGELDITFKKNAIKTRAGALHQITYRPKKDLPKERRAELVKKYGKGGVTAYFGVAAGRVIAVYGEDARQRARALMRAKPRAKKGGAELAKVLEDAKTRGESFVLAMDIAALAKPDKPAKDVAPMVIGFKANGDTANLRVTMPAAQVREAQGM